MDNQLRFLSIGSGSSGNCYYIGTDAYGFLIDAGMSPRAVKKALKEKGLSENIWGIFITHDHTDHVRFVGPLSHRLHNPVYSTQEVHEAIRNNVHLTDKPESANCKCFRKGDHIKVRDFDFQAFPVSHDAADCMGYSITYHDQRLVIATDLGFIGMEAAEHIARANYLVIEANYDESMLLQGHYPPALKQRVHSHTGHLCNTHTAKFLADNWHEGLTHVFLCHLSQDNNTPDKAYDTIHQALQAKGIELKVLKSLPRTAPSELYVLEKK